MSAKHTPGPWRWDGNVCDYDPENEAPWLVTEMHSAVVLGGSINCGNEANARLIAAAPDLLDALQAFATEIVPNNTDDPLWMSARAAIAKATGSTT